MSSLDASSKRLPPRSSETNPRLPATPTSSADYSLRGNDKPVAPNEHRPPGRCSLGPRADRTSAVGPANDTRQRPQIRRLYRRSNPERKIFLWKQGYRALGFRLDIL